MQRPPIPIIPAAAPGAAACDGGECFALLVLGEAMAPEFRDGDVIVVEPDGLAADGAYVVARPDGEWMLRQLVARGDGWTLRALDARSPAIDLPDLGCVRGVVIQKSRPGRRRSSKRYGS